MTDEDLLRYAKSRFVECKEECTREEKDKCLMFPDYCEGECSKQIDLFSLLNANLDKELLNNALDEIKIIKKENEELLDKLNLQNQRLNELKKENEELKAQIEKMK